MITVITAMFNFLLFISWHSSDYLVAKPLTFQVATSNSSFIPDVLSHVRFIIFALNILSMYEYSFV